MRYRSNHQVFGNWDGHAWPREEIQHAQQIWTKEMPRQESYEERDTYSVLVDALRAPIMVPAAEAVPGRDRRPTAKRGQTRIQLV